MHSATAVSFMRDHERVQKRSETVIATIKRHTAIFCYNSSPWNRQPQQLWQRLNPLRRIQSSGDSGRSASTASIASFARRVVAPAYASTASTAITAPSA